eukprot:12010352-Karenia_brevis.AAC.1
MQVDTAGTPLVALLTQTNQEYQDTMAAYEQATLNHGPNHPITTHLKNAVDLLAPKVSAISQSKAHLNHVTAKYNIEAQREQQKTAYLK